MNTTSLLPIVIESRRDGVQQYEWDKNHCVWAGALIDAQGNRIGTRFNMGVYHVDFTVITTADGVRLYKRISDFYIQTVSEGFGPGERYFLHD